MDRNKSEAEVACRRQPVGRGEAEANVGAPDLVGRLHLQLPQQIWILRMRGLRQARPTLRGHRRDASLAHQPPQPLTVEHHTRTAHLHQQLALPVE